MRPENHHSVPIFDYFGPLSEGVTMPPKVRPRPYTTLDRDYLSQDTVRELGERFGAEGPLVFLAIILGAGKVTTGGTQGVVALRWTALAREAFSTVKAVRRIVSAAIELGLLADLDEMDAGRFSVRLAKFDSWESRPRSGAERMAALRTRREMGGDDVA